tara:strand:- start:5583 stop:7235 length:1653 start_codon:yes stop_codon:yes gene_type:complete
MKKITKQLIFIYFLFVIVKSLLSYFIPSPSAFSDEYIYTKMARSIFYSFNFDIHGSPSHAFLPLYPLALSFSYIFKDMQVAYIIMKIINSFLSSLIIFPAWLISKEFMSKKKAILPALLVSVIPATFSFSPYIMAENLFYPLFLFTIFFTYKYLKENSYGYAFLSGLFLGLVYLTRIIGTSLIPIIVLLSLYQLTKSKLDFKKTILLFVTAFITVLPWVLRNGFLFGFTLNGLMGGYIKEVSRFSLPSFSAWFFLYIGFIILTSGIFFFIPTFLLVKNKKTKLLFLIFLLSTLSIILIGANHNAGEPHLNSSLITGRPIGRYVDTTLPLLFILGFIGLNSYQKNKKQLKSLKKTSYLIVPFIITSSFLAIFPLFPINNMSLIWLGLMDLIVGALIHNLWIKLFILASILISLTFLIYKYFFKLDLKKLTYLFILFFTLVSLSNYAATYYNSNTFWYQGEQMQLGLWLKDYDKSTSNILIDQRDCGPQITKLNQYNLCDPAFTLIGFWLNDNIKVQKPNNLEEFDYIISRHILPLDIIKETPSGIKVYKTL